MNSAKAKMRKKSRLSSIKPDSENHMKWKGFVMIRYPMLCCSPVKNRLKKKVFGKRTNARFILSLSHQ